ncbi:MAG TPA: response regulator transcription factor [Candidatus Methylomirabilis sp.]|nr:response regulator transcription factor [Candidatus Methylomirabilis sp.]
MTPYRIVLADDHVLLRQGLRRIIEGVGDLEVVGEASDGLELLGLLKQLTPQLVVLDISMPHLRGIEAIHEIKVIHPQIKVLMLTMHREMPLLNAAISAGADGYLLKEDADAQLFSAIEKIRQGRTYVSPKLSDELTDDWTQTCRRDRSPAWEAERLTVREREVLKLIAEGKSSKEIADMLCISHRTVEHHRAKIMAKQSLKNTAELVKYAMSSGYI